MANVVPEQAFDVVVVDEAQDFSANQLRAIVRHLADDGTVTFVTDTAQRIYPRGVPWAETGITIPASRSFQLTRNYRNTRQIAALASSIASGLPIDDDGRLPNPAFCNRDGPSPQWIRGTFQQQLDFALAALAKINTDEETVGFLHLKGGGWFDAVRGALNQRGYSFCELQGASDWPEDGPNIGLCTLHSAKGLEFDHVFMIGLAQAHASYGAEPDDDRYASLRRLFAMGIGRARNSILLGSKPGEALHALNLIDPACVEQIDL